MERSGHPVCLESKLKSDWMVTCKMKFLHDSRLWPIAKGLSEKWLTNVVFPQPVIPITAMMISSSLQESINVTHLEFPAGVSRLT
jgi:hypothetical protein